MNASETWLIHDEIFGERIYERGGVSIRDGDTVIDIGANIGLFLLYATDHFDKLRIVCFEPIPDTFSVLNRNAELVDDTVHNVTLVNKGVWETETTTTFRHLPRFSCSSTMCPDDSDDQRDRALEFTLNAFDQHPNRALSLLLKCLPKFVRVTIAKGLMRYHAKSESIECSLTTISNILRDHDLETVDYLKLDAEGAEIEILRAIEPADWPKIRQISVETHRGDATMREVEQILQARGFETETSFSQSSPADKMVYGRRVAVADATQPALSGITGA